MLPFSAERQTVGKADSNVAHAEEAAGKPPFFADRAAENVPSTPLERPVGFNRHRLNTFTILPRRRGGTAALDRTTSDSMPSALRAGCDDFSWDFRSRLSLSNVNARCGTAGDSHDTSPAAARLVESTISENAMRRIHAQSTFVFVAAAITACATAQTPPPIIDWPGMQVPPRKRDSPRLPLPRR